eukprot:9469722-Pyramimonas_sp.AAC.1
MQSSVAAAEAAGLVLYELCQARALAIKQAAPELQVRIRSQHTRVDIHTYTYSGVSSAPLPLLAQEDP